MKIYADKLNTAIFRVYGHKIPEFLLIGLFSISQLNLTALARE